MQVHSLLFIRFFYSCLHLTRFSANELFLDCSGFPSTAQRSYGPTLSSNSSCLSRPCVCVADLIARALHVCPRSVPLHFSLSMAFLPIFKSTFSSPTNAECLVPQNLSTFCEQFDRHAVACERPCDSFRTNSASATHHHTPEMPLILQRPRVRLRSNKILRSIH